MAQIAVPAEEEGAHEQQPDMLKVVTQRCSAALGIVPDDLEVDVPDKQTFELPPTRSARLAHQPSRPLELSVWLTLRDAKMGAAPVFCAAAAGCAGGGGGGGAGGARRGARAA